MQVGETNLEKKENERYLLKDEDFEVLPVYTFDTDRKRMTLEAIDHLNALKNIENALSMYRLSKNEVRVYLYLARLGANIAKNITESLGIHRTETYNILKRLESQGLISRIIERPMKFVAVPFEIVLNNLIKERRHRIHQMEQRKEQLLKIWKSLPETESETQIKETFQVLEGKRHISARLVELLENSNEKFELVVCDNNLLWLFNTPFLDELDQISIEEALKVRLLTNYSPTSSYVLDQMKVGDGDFAYLRDYELPGYFISDEKEMILLMPNDKDIILGMWTNYDTIVKSYSILFNLLWKDAKNS
jgi:sugar-specific transcriptional regulator TrmB